METIIGEGWSMDYIIKSGKLVGVKYHGTSKHMKEAFGKVQGKVLEAQLVLAKTA